MVHFICSVDETGAFWMPDNLIVSLCVPQFSVALWIRVLEGTPDQAQIWGVNKYEARLEVCTLAVNSDCEHGCCR